ncbi:epithelial discoidin domain-containing receptor 1 isoform X3 [Heterocephalus glaber]|uniref:Tyrosine-protein kinase receptor n=1 Tax=Heterocephalus glaber TaxID=10181 RepID=A0A0P6J8N1_HETGA|nr:epithelial discoidin domain-containing receptor 1 isoform X3 [Heterocephalus glaber]XP_012928353.1 epithelial discoidin domain-containing receptor 1 isoform X3 [Heterocephalus glaber]XP_012928355.1 epithelial discoidin domain-containing receptor 1 isoform X3 [Heterocephalus glaber]XP_012928356.1 epithelial discoidin domain-containing receptor 1 isoform X3 [Heterocephalus glaber]XP_012928357.1 epithelial discoidin domain-containing receptor 1 isoform X3 [Heterocephalus glaber]XP_012928358.1 
MGPGALGSLLSLLLLLLADGDADMKGHFDPAKCRYALGMQDRTIPDSDISVSSSWSDSTAARHSRLESSDGDGAWCPAGPVFPKEEEYLQVDLRQLHLVALVGTQGRHAGGLGKEFSRSYRLRYSRDGHRWMDWKDRWGQEVISGNEDPGGVVLKDLGPPMVARLVRFYPRADRIMSVCLRVELYGCLWRDGLLSYTAPLGQTMYLSEAVPLNDSTYDGFTVSGLQYGGLGQLADGVVGLDDFRQSQELRVWPGYDYVGWDNHSFPSGYVEMEFEFDRLRAFQAMQVHCNNMHTLGARLPGGVECRFKRGPAMAWEGEPVRHALGGSLGDPRARAVSVPLGGRLGRFLQCRFLFAGPWLLFSEISFISDVGNDSSPAPGGTFPPAPWWPPGPPPTNVSSLELEPRGQQPVAKAEGSPTAILIGCLVAIILLLLLIIALMLWRLHWRRLLSKAERRVLEEELTVHLSVPGDTILINNRPAPREPPPYQEPRPRGNPPHSAPCIPNGSALLLSNPAYRLLLATYARPPRGPGPPTPAWAKPTNTQACSGDYMEPEKPGAPLLAPPPNSVPHYAEADIVTLQGVTGGNTYAVPALPQGAAGDGPPRVDFPRSRLRFKEKLGEGQFGEVHLCEVENPQDLASLDFPVSVRKGQPLLVAVKILRPDATKNARNDFLKEVKIMSRLKDPNIIRLLGVCVQDDPLCMITDYMENGDLNQFLSAHQLEDKVAEVAPGDQEAVQGPTISYPILLHVAAQIASGMRYLATLNFVHRDLATRNCLVGENFTIKIADFGMSRNLYAGDYYRVQGRAVLPIRWMAWECILMGKFTTASDVWAFGVTLWEVLMLCRAQPFGQLTDEQVIENAGEFFRDQGRQVYLSRPPACPQGLYELMLQCWSREPEQRPPFAQLHRFLAEDALNTV